MNVSLHRARTAHPCGGYRCGRQIEPGELYVRHVYFPGDEGFEYATAPSTLRECGACADRFGQWVRDHYGVPAHLGRRVVFDGQPGVIVGLHSGQVHVRLDDGGRVVPVHPTWRMEYLESETTGAGAR